MTPEQLAGIVARDAGTIVRGDVVLLGCQEDTLGLVTDRRALLALVRELREFARHSQLCAFVIEMALLPDPRTGARGQCDCGFDTVLRSFAALSEP